MASPSFWFGTGAFAGTITAAIAALQATTPATQNCLVVLWDDIKIALPDGPTATPNTGEDWLAAINYHGLDRTANTLNSDRRASFALGGITIDQGFYLPGQNFIVYPVTANFYSPSSLNARPSAVDL